MKIIHVLWSLSFGGAERFVLDVAQEQAKEHEVIILAVTGGAMEPLFAEAGLLGSIFGQQPKGLKGRYQLTQFFKEQFLLHKPDLVHTHLGADIWAGLFAAKPLGIPWVTTVHSHEHDVHALSKLLKYFAYRKSQSVIAISASVSSMLQMTYGLSVDRLQVIPLGFRFDRFAKRSPHPLSDTPSFITVGRLAEEKGHEIVLRALAQLTVPWKYTIVGDGYLRPSLKLLSEQLGISQRIRWIGSVAEPRHFLAEADLFLMPSLHEGQGIVLLEAMAVGIPAIASDLPVFREHFDHRSLRTFEVGNVTALVGALHEAILNYTDAQARATQAQMIVQKQFDVRIVAKHYLDLYQTLL